MKILIATALELEYNSVVSILKDYNSEVNENIQLPNRVYSYNKNKYECEIVLVEIGEKNVTAGLNTAKAIDYFKPDYAFLSGIAGGIKDVKLGDVVVSDQIRSYESGKVTNEGVLPRSLSFRAAPELINLATVLKSNDNHMHGVFVKPIASGEKVIADIDNETYNIIKSCASDALALETEGYGFIEAVINYSIHYKTVHGIIVRGISDLLMGKTEADESGSQYIASDNAAAFVLKMIDSLIYKSNSNTFKETDSITAYDLLKGRVHDNFFEYLYFEREAYDRELYKIFEEKEEKQKNKGCKVSIIGASLAGKSRMALNFIKNNLDQNYLVHIFNEDSYNYLRRYNYSKDKKYLVVIDDINLFDTQELKKLFDRINHAVDIIITCSSYEWENIPDYIKIYFDSEIKIAPLTTTEIKEFTAILTANGIKVKNKNSSIGGMLIDVKGIQKKLDEIIETEQCIYPLFKAIYYFSMWKRLNKGNVNMMFDFLKQSYPLLKINDLYAVTQILFNIGILSYKQERDENNMPHIYVEEYIVEDIIINYIYDVEEKSEIELARRLNTLNKKKAEIECRHISKILDYETSFTVLTKVFWRVKYIETKRYISNLFFPEQVPLQNEMKTDIRSNKWVTILNDKMWRKDEDEDENSYHRRFISGMIYYATSFDLAYIIYNCALKNGLEDSFQLGCLISKIENPEQLELVQKDIENFKENNTDINAYLHIYRHCIGVSFNFNQAWAFFIESVAKLLDFLGPVNTSNIWLDEDENFNNRNEIIDANIQGLIYNIFQKAKTIDQLNQIEDFYNKHLKSVFTIANDSFFSSLPVYIHRILIQKINPREKLALLEKHQNEIIDDRKRAVIENAYIDEESDFYEAIEIYEHIATRDAFTFSFLLRKDNCDFDSAKEIFLSDYARNLKNVNDVILNILLIKSPNSTEADWVLSLFDKYNVDFDNYTLNAILKFDWITPTKGKELIDKRNWYELVSVETLGRLVSKKETSFDEANYYIRYDAKDPFKNKLPKELFSLARNNFEIKKELFAKYISKENRKLLDDIFLHLKKETGNSVIMNQIYGRYIANRTLISSYQEAITFLEQNDITPSRYDRHILGNLMKLLGDEYRTPDPTQSPQYYTSEIDNLIVNLSGELQYLAITSHRLFFFRNMYEKQNCIFIKKENGSDFVFEKECDIVSYTEEIIRLGYKLNNYTIDRLIKKLRKNDSTALGFLFSILEKSDIKLDNELFNTTLHRNYLLFKRDDDLKIRLESFFRRRLDNAYFISQINAGAHYTEILQMLHRENKEYFLSLSFWNFVLKKLNKEDSNKNVFQEGCHVYENYIKGNYKPSVHTFVSLFALTRNEDDVSVALKLLNDSNSKVSKKAIIHINAGMYTCIIKVQPTIEKSIQKIKEATEQGIVFTSFTFNILLQKYILEEKKNKGKYENLLSNFSDTLISGKQIDANILTQDNCYSNLEADRITFNTMLQLSSFTDRIVEAMNRFCITFDGYSYFTIVGSIPVSAPDAFVKAKKIAEKCKQDFLLTNYIFDLLFQRAKTLEDICEIYILALSELQYYSEPHVVKAQKEVQKEIQTLSKLLDDREQLPKLNMLDELSDNIVALTTILIKNFWLIQKSYRIKFRYNYLLFLVNKSIANWKQRKRDPYYKILTMICNEYVSKEFNLAKGGEKDIEIILKKHIGCKNILSKVQ